MGQPGGGGEKPPFSACPWPQESEEEDADAMDEDTGSEETGSELRDDQTDTSSTRPRRAVTLRSSLEPERRPPVERPRRGRRAQAASCAEGGEQGAAGGQDPAEVRPTGPPGLAGGWGAATAC